MKCVASHHHSVAVDRFWIDRTPVTNRQFKAFVRATGHVTVAELKCRPRAKAEEIILGQMLGPLRAFVS
jgi:formylglycine-generating enzyme required for sulfatase activity